MSDQQHPLDDSLILFQDLLWPSPHRRVDPVLTLLERARVAHHSQVALISRQDLSGRWRYDVVGAGLGARTGPPEPHPGMTAALEGTRLSLSRDVNGSRELQPWRQWLEDHRLIGGAASPLAVTERSALRAASLMMLQDQAEPASLPLSDAWLHVISLSLLCRQHGLDMQRAMDSRGVVGQAQGIVMQRYGIGAEQSIEVLKRYSSQLNRKLRQVADDVIKSRRLPEVEESPPQP